MQLPTDVRAVVTRFVYNMWNGLLEPDLLGDLGYREVFLEEPSSAEQAVAVYLNVLTLDEAGQVTNARDAERRAAQWICTYFGRSVDPPLANWGTEGYPYHGRASGPRP